MALQPDRLFGLLIAHSSSRAFNQYRDMHPDLDLPGGAAIRTRNLRGYLEAFSHPRFILVGEAAGYAGCRFSGIPFTAEAQLVGTGALDWVHGKGLRRSGASLSPWDERSARAVWAALSGRTDCLLWNAFPWHPYGPSGPLSNWPPGRDLCLGLEALHCVLALFPFAQPVAVGRTAQRALEALGVPAPYIRHPSHGGKRDFEAGLAALPPCQEHTLHL